MILLSVLGLSLIVARSKLFQATREHPLAPKYFLSCLQCFSFWVGCFWGLYEFENILLGIKLGFQASAVGWLLNELFPKPTIRKPNIGE